MKKVFVTYFTHSGNTKTVAEKICEQLNAEIFELKTVDIYPVKYNLVVDQAKKEITNNYRPELLSTKENFNEYDIIVIGYPIWWYTCPMVIFTFLEQYDFKGKTILPFCTHEGSGLSTSVEDIKKSVPTAIVKEGLAIRGSKVKESDTNIKAWLIKTL
jgi:flavodoxin